MARTRPAGWWYPWIFVAGMAVVVAVNAVMIAYAIGTFPGLSTEDAYRKGLAYNQTIAASRAQDERRWRAEVGFAEQGFAGSHAGDLTVTLIDDDGRPLRGLAVSATLIRPVHSGGNVVVSLDERGSGTYTAAVVLPLPGQWDAWIRARGEGFEFQTTRRIFVP